MLQEWEGLPHPESPPQRLAFPSGAVPLDDPFYIARPIDSALLHHCGQPGQTITVTGPRQVGKTSLLIRGMRHARSTLEARVLYLDLQSLTATQLGDSHTFLRLLADWLLEELELPQELVAPAWESRLGSPRKLTKLLENEILPLLDQPLLLALDEVDRLLATPFHTEFFGLLRAWHNLRAWNPIWKRLTLLMGISTEPYLLIDNLQQSPFNVGLICYLQDFSQEECAVLNTRYGSPLSPSHAAALYKLLNGHPFLTRLALYTAVTQADMWHTLLADPFTERTPFISHLRYQRTLVQSDPALVAALKQILADGSCSDSASLHRLQKAGLVHRQNQTVDLRCQLYRDYFLQTL